MNFTQTFGDYIQRHVFAIYTLRGAYGANFTKGSRSYVIICLSLMYECIGEHFDTLNCSIIYAISLH